MSLTYNECDPLANIRKFLLVKKIEKKILIIQYLIELFPIAIGISCTIRFLQENSNFLTEENKEINLLSYYNMIRKNMRKNYTFLFFFWYFDWNTHKWYFM